MQAIEVKVDLPLNKSARHNLLADKDQKIKSIDRNHIAENEENKA